MVNEMRSHLAEDGPKGDKSRSWLITFLIPLIGGMAPACALLWQTAEFHAGTVQNFANITEHVEDIKKSVVDVRAEQEAVKRHLGEEHDKVISNADLIHALTENLMDGRKLTQTRLAALEQAMQAVSEANAVIKQAVLDTKEDTMRSLHAHDGDLAAIRDKLGVPTRPRDR